MVSFTRTIVRGEGPVIVPCHATKLTRHGPFHWPFPGRPPCCCPVGASALSTTNSDNADLMLADMALSRGDCRGGTERYLKAALGHERCEDLPARQQGRGGVPADRRQCQAARRWQKLEPESADAAAAAVALAAVRLYQPEEASAAILRTKALGGDEALIKLIGELSDAGGSSIALDTLRPLLESPDVSDTPARGRHRPRARNLRLHHRAQTRGPHAGQ